MSEYPKNDKQIEEAIKFLVNAIHKSCKNNKPVILHSVRIGLHLDDLKYDKDIVMSAILHDIIEDTDTTFEEIKSKFSNRIATLVKANSFDESIKDKTERYKENFERCKAIGKDALIIRTADFLDNINYYHLAPNAELEKWLFEKLKYFIDNSYELLKDEIIYIKLVEKYNRISNNKIH
jgi:(p)ppGpp synthase/HD superfamily hydrolase